jgi:lincosamide nucleotidyltransferase A/C/D/E
MASHMSGSDAVAIIKLLTDNGIHVWVDGGWGVDALIGHQTRAHTDLDIAVQHRDDHKIKWLLGLQGFRVDHHRADTTESNFVMTDQLGHEVDIHCFTFDSEGNNIFGVAYKPDHLSGQGVIEGYTVNCIPPDVMMEFKTGYEVSDDDYHDVTVLSDKFGLPIPSTYKKFKSKK